MGKRVLVSGYFDPLHIGHIDLFQLAKNLAGEGGKLIVVVNNDYQASLKKGRPFMPHEERINIIKNLRMVDEVILSIDEDKTICKTLEMINPDIFANGGDPINIELVPEKEVCDRLGIEMVINLGKKLQSSSALTGMKGTYSSENK